jgi:starch phosphorylase
LHTDAVLRQHKVYGAMPALATGTVTIIVADQPLPFAPNHKGARGKKLVNWQHTLEQKWDAMRFGEIKVETNRQQHIFEVTVYLNDIDPNAVLVELYADGVMGSAPVRQEMKRGRQLVGAVRGYIYSVTVSATRPATDYTERVIPNYDSVAVPLEAAQMLWQPR